MMEKDTEAKWGNWMGYVLLPFTIGLRDDPLDYIRHAKATVDRKKNSLEASSLHFLHFRFIIQAFWIEGINIETFNFIYTSMLKIVYLYILFIKLADI